MLSRKSLSLQKQCIEHLTLKWHESSGTEAYVFLGGKVQIIAACFSYNRILILLFCHCNPRNARHFWADVMIIIVGMQQNGHERRFYEQILHA